jgi:hypothetical protein
LNYIIENYFHFQDSSDWTCGVNSIDNNGNVTIVVLPIPPQRSRLVIEISGVIYWDMHMGWHGCHLNIASSSELEKMLSEIGDVTVSIIGKKTILTEYKLFVFQTSGRNIRIVAKNASIVQVLP